MKPQPICFGTKTLSNKPYGIMMYYQTSQTIKVKTWYGHRYVSSPPYWQHLHNTWYRSQKSQRQALDDLNRNRHNDIYKFIPFTNNYKRMPSDGMSMIPVKLNL